MRFRIQEVLSLNKSERVYEQDSGDRRCWMLGKSERVKAPTALPTAMESACTGPGDPEASATRPITLWRYCRAVHHEPSLRRRCPSLVGCLWGLAHMQAPPENHMRATCRHGLKSKITWFQPNSIPAIAPAHVPLIK